MDDINLAKTIRRVKLWKCAARTVPIAILAALTFLHFIGWDTLYEKLITISGTTFIAICVFWWWWAVNKIISLANIISRTGSNLKEIKNEIISIKKEL
jgi:hypothetical protein